MNESIRTAGFAVIAAGALLFAWWAAPTTATRSPERQNKKIGEEFFPDFKNPNEATGLRVAAFDSLRGRPKEFQVEFRNGLWTIPTHHNYPADAQTRLAKTAASLLGIKREELHSTNASDQSEFGVVDPLDASDSGKKQGMGQRLTLTKGDTTLLDLIVGKPVKGRSGYYYVRRPDEKGDIYIAKLANVDFSTRFSDWIETDLLKIEGEDLSNVIMDNYTTDADRGVIMQGDINELSRDKSADPWVLKDLKADKEELDTGKLSQMVDALDNLKLVGVRPKPKGLSDTLKNPKDGKLTPEDVRDLDDKGFVLAQGDLYAKYGKFTAATNKGAVYLLRFGDTDFGSEEQVESGLEAGKPVPANKDKKAKKKDEKAAAGSAQPPRYLFITAEFNEKYVSPKPSAKPTAPVKPEPPAKPQPPVKPAADKPADPAKPTAPADKSDAKTPAKPAEKTADKPGEKAAEKPAEKPAAKPEPADKPDPAYAAAEKKYQADLKKYEEAKRKYDDDLKKYEDDQKAYEKKVEEGRKFVKELNDRFADWYYVIPGDAYAQLRVARKDLVKPKQAAAPATKPGQPPLNLGPGTPSLEDLKNMLPKSNTPPSTPTDDKPQIRPEVKSPTTPADKPVNKATEKPPEKTAEKTAPKVPEKSPEKPVDKPAAEKPPEKKAATTASEKK